MIGNLSGIKICSESTFTSKNVAANLTQMTTSDAVSLC